MSGKINEMIAVSTRVRLARNLADTPFPRRLTEEEKYKVCKKVTDAYLKSAPAECADCDIIDMGKLGEAEAMSLAERRLISPEFAAAGAGGCLILTKDHSVSIMVNEEDHIRIQVILSGLRLKEAYALADRIDDALNSELAFAFDERLGYLTECPTNLGTAMRASVMLHLPATRAAGGISGLAETVSRLGFTVRGAYGEDSEATGGFYQISNQITLGISETAAIENLENITGQIISGEESRRLAALENPAVKDKLWRSLGILRTARLLSGSEAIELAGNLRLGIAEGVYEGEKIDIGAANRIVNSVGAATVTAKAKKELTPQQRDTLRAAAVREIMNG